MKVLIAAIAALIVALTGGTARSQVPEAVAQGMAAVAEVHSADAAARFLGSALVWQDGEFALTNAHVTGSAARVELRFRDGSQVIVPVLARDPARDLALLDLPGARKGLWPAPGLPPP